MNETNRTVIVLLAAAAIVLMAVVIFVTWAAPEDAADRVQDLGEFLVAHQDSDASRLILTLGALVVVILALLTIIVELAPAEETHDLRVKQAGTTTILPAQALQQRLEEALLALPMIAAAQARVSGGDRGISTTLDLTIFPDANLAAPLRTPAASWSIPSRPTSACRWPARRRCASPSARRRPASKHRRRRRP